MKFLTEFEKKNTVYKVLLVLEVKFKVRKKWIQIELYWNDWYLVILKSAYKDT